MRSRTAKDLCTLRRRVRRFLRSPQPSRSEAGRFLETVSEAGEVAIFGGMLRDIALLGSAGFKSDVDAVIDCKDRALLVRILGSYAHERNRFGGYRVYLSCSSVDLWPLESTWAFRAGLVRGQSFSDLPRTTFFDWDAIAFELRAGRFHCIDGYLDRLNRRVVDINLPENPNVLGTVIRTLRLVVSRKAALSTRLAVHLHEHLPRFETSTLCEAERRSFEGPLLVPTVVDATREHLSRHLQAEACSPFLLPALQGKD